MDMDSVELYLFQSRGSLVLKTSLTSSYHVVIHTQKAEQEAWLEFPELPVQAG